MMIPELGSVAGNSLLTELITTWRLYGSTLRLCSFIENTDNNLEIVWKYS